MIFKNRESINKVLRWTRNFEETGEWAVRCLIKEYCGFGAMRRRPIFHLPSWLLVFISSMNLGFSCFHNAFLFQQKSSWRKVLMVFFAREIFAELFLLWKKDYGGKDFVMKFSKHCNIVNFRWLSIYNWTEWHFRAKLLMSTIFK